MFDSLTTFFSKLNNVEDLLRWGGYIALMAIIFSETGIFLGFFLPGDSLLVTAGLLAAKGDFNLAIILGGSMVCAILGDAVGFEIGKVSGQALLTKKDSRLFKRRHLEQTQAFYQKHGGKAIILARFMPIARTFAPLVAGLAGMPYRVFAAFNVIGGVLWVGAMVGLGYLLGRVIPNIDKYIELVIATVIFLSILPAIVGYWRSRYSKKIASQLTVPEEKNLSS